ncbi:MAG: PASTA domain-containing protein [Elusimicrobia bacterium]|jgi:beta-lactam-binding protein with PASTA domain|nr:PASTA domain-containing protein [Elusimicrobiota bacterium]MBK7207883.1 PASTA domain-containing protein [Elusimicrobiota bacterium]MBK7544648.1 PASTA domain-containing protein [Elusimicrobiota bacterium]MBK7574180.1 PASTA domain-containing protein [Elusimicrobiota bacterium]MBK7688880.1 PASTA domain-containing protein [Elusimicrobiota bacterium]
MTPNDIDPVNDTPGVWPLSALRRRSWGMWGGLFVIALLATLFSLHWVMSALLHSRKVVQVPDLTGKTLEQALDLLAPLNLSLSKEGIQFDEKFQPGAIVRQAPPAGLRVREWKIVRVTLSSGGQILYVPDTAGATLTEAQNRLRTAGLSLGAVSQVYSNKFETGLVMAQNPDAGTLSHPGAMVDLTVSKGGPPAGTVLMPDFVNKPYSLARQWAEDQSLTPAVQETLTEDALPGLVLKQNPGPDTPVGDGAEVRFVVSKSDRKNSKDVTLIRYNVPEGTDRVRVRIVLRDDAGEREIFSDEQSAGARVEVPVSVDGPARARIFVNGVLVEERPLGR